MSDRRSSSSAIAYGGAAGILAAVLFASSLVLVQVAPVSQTYESTSSYVNSALVAAAFVAAAVSVLGILAAHRGHAKFGRVGAVGGWLAVGGYLVVALHSIYAMIVGNGQSAIAVRIGAAAALVIGSALLGIMTLRSRVLPWWCGALLIVAFPLGDIAEAAVAGIEAFFLALLWGSVGAALIRLRAGSITARAAAEAR